MKLNCVQEMRKTFGDDTLFLIGGALLEQGPDLEEDAKLFAHCAGRDRLYCAAEEVNKSVSGKDAYIDKTHYIARTTKDKENDLTSSFSTAEVEQVANAVRRRVLEYTLKNNGGYLSQACSSAEVLATLYLKSLRFGPSVSPSIPPPFRGSPGPGIATITGEGYNGDPTAPHLDRLIFSPVHYALPLYSLLVEVGRLDAKAFDSYNKDGSTVELIGAEHSPGHAVTAGSLAQALSQAAGIAFARKLKQHTGRVFVYMSDGEMQEGQTWEAVQLMVFHKIELTAVVDVNGQQCDGKMDTVCDVGSLANKLRAFGAVVQEVDGHNVQAIDEAVSRHRQRGPAFVLCHTDPCHGLPLLREIAPKLHYIRFKNAAEKLKWKEVLAKMEMTPKNRFDENSMKRQNCQDTTIVVENKLNLPLASSWLEQCSVFTDTETVTRPHQRHLLEWMKKNPAAIVLTADLTSSCEADLVRENLPNQYLSMGMAEQNMMSFAGGLAREGFRYVSTSHQAMFEDSFEKEVVTNLFIDRPFIHTFGVFLTRRPFDQVAMSIGVPNLPVRLLGFLPGLTTPGGITHQAVDDVALMRSIPNMKILEVGDATEIESVLDVANDIDGPVYIRMLRGEVPRLFPQHSRMQFGVARLLSNEKSCLSRDSDVALITCGICTEEALKARAMIQSSDVTILHVHLSTLVPFPEDIILRACNMTKFGIITMENHSIVGGVGSAAAEVLAEHAVSKPLIRLGVPSGTYCHGASREYLLRENELDAYALISAIEKLVCKKVTSNWAVGIKNGCHSTNSADRTERPEDL